MKRINKFLFYAVMLLLSIFIYISAFNLGFDTEGEGSGYLLYIGSLLGVEFFSVLYIIINIKKITVRKFLFFVLLWIVFMTFTQCFSGRFITNIGQVLYWPICFLVFYLFVRSDSKNFDRITHWYIFYFIIGFIVFVIVSITKTSLNLDNSLASTNNIFYPLLVLPWVLVQKRISVRNVLILLLLFAVTLSAKRSAMLVVFLILLPYLYYAFLKNPKISAKTRFFAPLILLIICSFIFIKINNAFDGYIWKRFESIEEDKGSGRLDIYANVYDMQMNSSIEEWIVGHGHQGVLRNYNGPWGEFSAHNDFQEVLYDYGIIVFILYLCLYFILFRKLYLLYRQKSEYFISYFGGIIIFLNMSAMSHLILYPTYFIFLTSFWGAMEGVTDNQRKVIESLRVY